MKRRFAPLLALSVLPLSAAERFAWTDDHAGHMTLTEEGKPALVYNYGPQLKAGMPEDRRRCCYIYPLNTPGGVSVLDDFPADHPHHRGLFWAWPSVETGGKTYDMWTLKGGMEDRFDGRISAQAGRMAILDAQDGWYADDRKVVKEDVHIEIDSSQLHARVMRVRIRLEAVDAPVTLRGSPDAGKSYGGFSARFAPRADTVIRTDAGVVASDEDLNRHAWAELEGNYGDRRAVLRITPDPSDPGAPYQWCLRKYGFVGASFPGKSAEQDSYTLQPGKPLLLQFAVRVADMKFSPAEGHRTRVSRYNERGPTNSSNRARLRSQAQETPCPTRNAISVSSASP